MSIMGQLAAMDDYDPNASFGDPFAQRFANAPPDAFEAAAARRRQPYRNLPEPGTAPLLGAPGAIMGAIAETVRGPGAAMTKNPYPEGSEEASFYEDQRKRNIDVTARDLALNTMGTGAIAGVPMKYGEVVLGAGPVRPKMGEFAASDKYEPKRAAIVMPTSSLRAPGDTRASTRFPTGVGATENPLTHQLSIGTAEMMASPNFDYNIKLLSTYPGFAHLKDMTSPQAARAYIEQARDNMQYLYDRSPAVMKARSPLWYEGAHEISDALARRWGVPRPSSSAALASLSPQMDWLKNASLGERTGDILLGAAAGKKMTPEMETFARAASEKGFLKGDVNAELLKRIRGKSLDQLDDPLDKALWIRLYDEAHNPRSYRTITPEGNFGEFVRNQGGEQAKVGWGALGEIQKAVRALESGGDMNIISPTLGSKHKVRSFYNNIENPNYPRFGDVTADTHQVAAAQMRPLSGASPAVAHNLASGGEAGAVNARSSALTGVQGLYGLTADATRMMAGQNRLVPRAAQSATWEPVRELFPAKWKTPANAKAVDDIWREYDAGRITIGQARDNIFNLAGGIGTPEWGRPGARTVAPSQGSTYR